VSFDPPALDTAAVQTSHEITVRIGIPPGTPPGPYRGYLLAAGLPEVSLALRLDVEQAG
jgi:hypothetical protein